MPLRSLSLGNIRPGQVQAKLPPGKAARPGTTALLRSRWSPRRRWGKIPNRASSRGRARRGTAGAPNEPERRPSTTNPTPAGIRGVLEATSAQANSTGAELCLSGWPVLPPVPPGYAGHPARRGHGFPRSHGPSEGKVNGAVVNEPLPPARGMRAKGKPLMAWISASTVATSAGRIPNRASGRGTVAPGGRDAGRARAAPEHERTRRPARGKNPNEPETRRVARPFRSPGAAECDGAIVS
jgi:hypothetical protein